MGAGTARTRRNRPRGSWARFLAPLAVLLAALPSSADPPAPQPPPTGPRIDGRPLRPASGDKGARVCSLRLPICVHGDAAPPRSLLAVLASAEQAWDVETGPLALPAPDPDIDTGAYDLYLTPGLSERAVTVAGARDPRSRIDRASAFTLLDPSLPLGDRCALDTAVASSVARASLFRAAPATDEGSARGEADYVARLAVPCAMGEADGISALQAAPERAIVDPGSALFFWWLDVSYGTAPGGLVRALWALAPTMTPLGASRWNDEPDGFDVLGATFKDALGSGGALLDVLDEFGTTRALLGLRENGAELPEARPLGAAVAPRVDWAVSWPTKPRRLASPVGLAPTGSAYVLVRRAGASPGARLRLEATWEQHAAIRWTVVKLDAAGRELGRIPVAAAPRATEAQATVVNLDAVDALLVVATNVGDPFAPFDPDDETFEPHGWLLTLASE